MRSVVAILGLVLFGCGIQAPPTQISIDPAFSAAETETIRAAVDAWCDAVGWCPEEAAGGEHGRIDLVDDIVENEKTVALCPAGAACTVSGRWQDGNIKIARNRTHADDLGWLWVYVAHEIGHYCIDHLDEGLMSAVATYTTTIDAAAVTAWHEGCPQ